MAHIIVNADDFGYSDGICRSILELLEAGAITGTSLMCAALGALERFDRWGASSLFGFAGVHLHLTGGRPLSSVNEVPTLLDHQSGNFRDPRVGGLPDFQEVELEWRRQIEAAYAALGGSPTHLDSHHGVHRIPELFRIYVGLAAEAGVPIRGAGGEIGQRMRKEGIAGTVALVRDWTGKSLGADALRQMVTAVISEYPKEEVLEVITHPGYSDDYLSTISSLSAAREDEHKSLLELAHIGWPMVDGHTLATHAICLSSSS